MPPKGIEQIKKHYELAQIIWRQCGLLNSKWQNVATHNLLAGIAAYNICCLAGLPQESSEVAVAFAIIHDFDKRFDRDKAFARETLTLAGKTMLSYDLGIEIR